MSPSTKTEKGIYADLLDLIKLEHKAGGFSFLPRQPVHSLLVGRHASRLRGRGLNFEEIRRYMPGLAGGGPTYFHVFRYAGGHEISHSGGTGGIGGVAGLFRG